MTKKKELVTRGGNSVPTETKTLRQSRVDRVNSHKIGRTDLLRVGIKDSDVNIS